MIDFVVFRVFPNAHILSKEQQALSQERRGTNSVAQAITLGVSETNTFVNQTPRPGFEHRTL